MRVGIATVYTPPLRGGAEFLADGLAAALQRAGHSIHRLVTPFSYASLDAAHRCMDLWESQDFRPFEGGGIDRVIGLKWPAYLMSHPGMTAWLLHQHRPAYDLFGTAFGFPADEPAAQALRERIIAADSAALGRMAQVFTISERVCDRLRQHNRLESTALYHPPDSADAFHCLPAEPYILVPSRLEALKRQSLLLQAMALTKSAVTAVVVGEGGLRAELEELAARLDLGQRVRFLGGVSRPHLIGLYARALAVFFGPQDEDYGYVTLEAMLAGKPVITCNDSGGPLEFVRDGETGHVVAPLPQAVAAAIDGLAADPKGAARMGEAGRARYEAMGLGWDQVVARLTGTSERPSCA